MRFDGKTNKQKATSLQINKLSSVAKPAHEGARAAILKAAEQKKDIPSEELIKDKANDSLLTTKTGEDKMSKEKTLEDIQKQLSDMEAKNTRLDSIVKMNPDVRGHFDSLDEKDQDNFLKLSDKEQKDIVEKKAEELKKAKDADESIIVHGQTILKSNDPIMFEVLKAQAVEMENLKKQAKIEKKARELQTFSKQAEEAWPNLPGNPLLKGKVLKSINEMDKDTADTLNAMLKNANENGEKLFKETGSSATPDESGPMEQLNKMAREYADKNDVDFYKAMDAVSQTDKGKALYDEMSN